MQDNRSEFQKRLDKIGADETRRYTRSQRGTRTGIYDFVEEDRRKARKPPYKALMFMFFLCWLLLVVLKAYLIADMGEAAGKAAAQREADLRNGNGRIVFFARFGAVFRRFPAFSGPFFLFFFL